MTRDFEAVYVMSDQELALTEVMHGHFRSVGRPDLCDICAGMKVTAFPGLGTAVSLLKPQEYDRADTPIVAEAMAKVNEALGHSRNVEVQMLGRFKTIGEADRIANRAARREARRRRRHGS